MTATRDRLLAAGKLLFSRLGIAKTTVREICSEAGVPSGSFYLFFPTKDELYAEILTASVAEHRNGNGRTLAAAAEVGAADSGRGAADSGRGAVEGGRRPEELLKGILSRMIAGIETDPILAQFHRRDSREAARRALFSARGGTAFAEISSGLDAAIAEWKAAGLVAGNLALPSNPDGWLGLGLLMFFYGTAFTALFVLLPRLDALNNSAALNFEPIAVLFLAWPILGQSVAPQQIAGALIVVGALIALGTAKR